MSTSMTDLCGMTLADVLTVANRAEKKLTQREPTLAMMEDWINQAKALGGKITY